MARKTPIRANGRNPARPRRARGAVAPPGPLAGPLATHYPNVAAWVAGSGWIELGDDGCSASFVRALDIGGMIWEGKANYVTVDAALADLDAAIAVWFKANP